MFTVFCDVVAYFNLGLSMQKKYYVLFPRVFFIVPCCLLHCFLLYSSSGFGRGGYRTQTLVLHCFWFASRDFLPMWAHVCTQFCYNAREGLIIPKEIQCLTSANFDIT